jgi:hypothetical protein
MPASVQVLSTLSSTTVVSCNCPGLGSFQIANRDGGKPIANGTIGAYNRTP